LGELFPRAGFIVTNLGLPSRTVVGFYNKLGTAEQRIKEGKQAVTMTRLLSSFSLKPGAAVAEASEYVEITGRRRDGEIASK
jgi:hypothetical protein